MHELINQNDENSLNIQKKQLIYKSQNQLNKTQIANRIKAL